jgi:LuxR family transcriptional regulator, regulator of acetate metabolism
MSATNDLDTIQKRLAETDAQLEALGHTQRAQEHREAIEQLRSRFEVRFDALARARSAAATLHRLTSPRELLLQAPQALCEGTNLGRAILSTIQESSLMALAIHFDDDPQGFSEDLLTKLQEQPMRLEHQLVEADVLRRRRATLVTNVEVNARVDRRMAELLGWHSYVAAPLMSSGTVIGMIHADRGPTQPLDVLDRDVLWEFASVLSQIHESAELRRTLRRERDELRRFLEWLNARSVSLADAPITFSAYVEQDGARATMTPVEAHGGQPVGTRDDRLVFSGLLTRRELDVLRLLADGGTNKTIADALVLSDTTVKFHVNSILRKLRVANRAEAVARYLSLLGVSLQ